MPEIIVYSEEPIQLLTKRVEALEKDLKALRGIVFRGMKKK